MKRQKKIFSVHTTKPCEFPSRETPLPDGWAVARIRDVVREVPNAKPPSEPDRQYQYIDISSIDNENYRIVNWKQFRGIDAPSRARRPIQSGDVLFSNVRTYLRNIALVPNGLELDLCSTGFTVLRSNGAVDPGYLFRYVLSDSFIDQVTPQQTGTHYPATSDRVVFDQAIPLPPVAEQRRIVARVEALLGRVQAARARLAKVPALLKRFRQSVLAAACSGELTKDWRARNAVFNDAAQILIKLNEAHAAAGGHKRGNAAEPTEEAHDLSENDLPATWCLTDLRTAVCPDRPITYGILKPGPDTPGGVPYVRVADFPNDRLSLESIRRTTRDIEQSYARARLQTGDLLLSIRGTVGRVCVVPSALRGANITQDTARLSIQPKLDGEFVMWFLRAPTTQNRMQRALKGVAVRGINIGDVRAIQLPVPPPAEQHEIVRRVEALFALADKIESRVALATQRVEKTVQAILAKAFRGELVPTEAELARQQNRDYEPATALLERIRAERKILEDKRVANKVARPKRRKVSDGKQRRRNAK